MKTKLTIFISILFCGNLFAQDITNTLGTSGLFRIRDNTNIFFTLTQSNGTIELIGPLAGNQRGSIFKGGNRFLHTYYGSGTAGFNTFLGINSGNFSLGGTSSSNGSYNTAVGYGSLSSLTTGSYNSAFGRSSLFYNTTGIYNSAFGENSLYSNTTGIYNSAFGRTSLYSNTTGDENSAFGSLSLYSNSTGNENSAFGSMSLSYNTTGSSNSAFGSLSLYNNTTGVNNSAFGNRSLSSNTTGSGNTAFGNFALYSSSGNYNTAIGDSAGRNITSGSNNIAIGYFAQVPAGSASNQIRLGNRSITYAGIQVAWTITSDRRYKDNITPIGLGLGFISKLNPVSYTRKNDENHKTEYGLIAQEVEEVLKSEGVENHAMLTVTDEGMYELRYNDLLAPMIKAIQELKMKNEELQAENENLKLKIDEIIRVVNELKHNQSDIKEVKLGDNGR
jgi:hypothetical protein